jgi:type IV secretory pathway VirB2 component (pilin)
MTSPAPKQATFLAKDTYRKRRMRDLARAVPVIGVVLLAIPMLWSVAALNSGATVYIFVVWVLLILLAAAISRVVSTDTPKTP